MYKIAKKTKTTKMSYNILIMYIKYHLYMEILWNQ